MANTSILNAFERMWQHVVAALSNKSDKDHKHSLDDINSTSSKQYLYIVNGTSVNNGSVYTATIDGYNQYTNGTIIIFIPQVDSSTTAPQLEINGMGTCPIMCTSSTAGYWSEQEGAVEDWLVSGTAYLMMYTGGHWLVLGHTRPMAEDIVGIVDKANKDGNGNVIADIYAKKTEVEEMTDTMLSLLNSI